MVPSLTVHNSPDTDAAGPVEHALHPSGVSDPRGLLEVREHLVLAPGQVSVAPIGVLTSAILLAQVLLNLGSWVKARKGDRISEGAVANIHPFSSLTRPHPCPISPNALHLCQLFDTWLPVEAAVAQLSLLTVFSSSRAVL